MSKNFNNILRNAYMRNFTNYTIERFIYIDIKNMSNESKNMMVHNINERLWENVQAINLLSDFNLPYVILRRVESSSGKQLRVIYDENDNKNMPKYINSSNSHIIRLQRATPQRIIQLGNFSDDGRADILADSHSRISAVVDTLLDISMFHSIPCLDGLKEPLKKTFNRIKYEYFKNKGYISKSYFYVNPDDEPTYISFAFAHHVTHDKINHSEYINCWIDFFNKYYKNEDNKYLSPSEQLKNHVHYKQLPDAYKSNEFWSSYSKGSYLLLRTNKRPNNSERINKLLNYFGESTYHIGLTKIVPLQEYHINVLKDDLKELNVSAFKIVVY